MMEIRYVSTGRLGDLIHVLYVIYEKWRETGKRGILYITDDIAKYGGDTFGFGDQQKAPATYEALYPILTKQEYIAEFHLLSPQDQMLPADTINLTDWRRIVGLNDWPTTLTNMYKLQNSTPAGPWLQPVTMDALSAETRDWLKDKILIHRSYITPHRCNPLFPWELILQRYGDRCVFISTHPPEYDHFAYKDKVPFFHVQNLSELMAAIASCAFFIGNQSSPIAFAWAMKIPCFAEVNMVDWKMYGTPHIWWYLHPQVHHIQGMEKHLSLL